MFTMLANGPKSFSFFESMLKARIGWRKFTSPQYVPKVLASNKLVEGNLPILHMFERSRLKNNSSESTELFHKQDLKERRKSSSSFLYSLEALLLVNCQSIFRSCTFPIFFLSWAQIHDDRELKAQKAVAGRRKERPLKANAWLCSDFSIGLYLFFLPPLLKLRPH